MQKDALEIENLTVGYDDTSVLWDINCTIPKGKLVGIIGPNGAGKSTLIKAILGFIKPLSGRTLFLGLPLKEALHKIAYVPQKETIDWNFPITAYEVVLMGRYGSLRFWQRVKKVDKEAAENALAMVGMSEFRNRQISQLSGGQQQRLFIARALVQEPEIFLLDEPFSGVDISTEKVIMSLLEKLKKAKKTIFVVHHDLNSVESYFDYLIMLNTKLISVGPTKKIFTKENIKRCFGNNLLFFDEVAKQTTSQEEL